MRLVLFTGGVDSTVVLAKALLTGRSPGKRAEEVKVVHFIYPSRQWEREQLSVIEVARRYDVDLLNPTVDGLGVPDAMSKVGKSSPTTVEESIVFGRNLVFLAEAVKLVKPGDSIWFGGSLEDAKAGYEDCQPGFVVPMQAALKHLGIALHVPLMYLNKVEVVELGMVLGAPLWLTYSCYEGQMVPCGVCPACVTRQKAFKEAGYDRDS
jgi:7-cyano-7-deazaguanine synthase